MIFDYFLNRLNAYTNTVQLLEIQKLANCATSERAEEIILNHFEKRFGECINEKHSNLLRQDIIQYEKVLFKK